MRLRGGNPQRNRIGKGLELPLPGVKTANANCYSRAQLATLFFSHSMMQRTNSYAITRMLFSTTFYNRLLFALRRLYSNPPPEK